jgi:hypothetical protein
MKVMLTAVALSVALVTSGAYAQGINLSGLWRCVAACAGAPGGIAYITQNGWDLNLVNEAGIPSRAWIDYPGHIWVQRANEGAIYSPDGFALQFDHGTIWQRAPLVPPLPPPVRSRG